MSLLPFLLRGDPAIEIANVSYGLLVRIHRMNLFADSTKHGEWWDPGSDEDLSPNRHPDRVRHIYSGLGGIAQAVIARIADNANHLKPAVAPGDRERKRRLALHLGHAELAANGNAGSRQQQKRQGNLAGDQDAVSPAAMKSGGHFARSRLHHLSYIRTRGLKSRRDAEDDAGQQRKTNAEIQNRQIDADGGFMGEREFREPIDDELHQAICQRHANDRPGERQHQRFREQLPQDARALGANRRTHRHLVLALRGPGQQENRNISAADQQQQNHRREQQRQRAADLIYELIVQTFESHAEVLREVL